MMTNDVAVFALLVVLMVVREVLHYKQVTRLQELLKSVDISDYYRASRGDTPKGKKIVGSVHANQIMDEPNEMAIDDPQFDITKITNVNVDGQDKPIQIF